MRAGNGVVQVDRELCPYQGANVVVHGGRRAARGGVWHLNLWSRSWAPTTETNNMVHKAEGDFEGLGNRSRCFFLGVGMGNYFFRVERVRVDNDDPRTGWLIP